MVPRAMSLLASALEPRLSRAVSQERRIARAALQHDLILLSSGQKKARGERRYGFLHGDPSSPGADAITAGFSICVAVLTHAPFFVLTGNHVLDLIPSGGAPVHQLQMAVARTTDFGVQ